MRVPLVIALAAAWLVVVTGSAAATSCITSSSCDDGDFCNGIERCTGGECVTGPPLVCDDGDPCTRDVCDPAIGCVHPEDQCPTSCVGLGDGTRCADGSVCTRGDTCAGEVCVPGAAVDCDDGDGCTRETCDPTLGCTYTEEADAAPCAPDCNGAAADYTPCPGDGDICTRDGCLPSVDLIGNPHMCIPGLLALERQCQDGDVCNGEEFCSPVLGCQSGPPLVCDDGNVCNGAETCDPVAGCQPGTPQPDGTTCDDGRQCTTGDACSGGACTGAPLPPSACDDADPATADTCEEGFGCVHCVPAITGRVTLRVGAGGKMKARGELPGNALAAMAPATDPVGVLVEDGATTVVRLQLPAGALVGNAAATRFGYRDPAGSNDGVRRMRIQARGPAVKWNVSAADVALPSVSAAAVTVRLVVGTTCFEATPACTVSGTRVTCR